MKDSSEFPHDKEVPCVFLLYFEAEKIANFIRISFFDVSESREYKILDKLKTALHESGHAVAHIRLGIQQEKLQSIRME